jgi:hypothetical protein
MQIHLAEKLMRQEAARVIVDRRRALIAGRFNRQNTHGT